VAVGETETGVPLATEMLPGVITPLPLLKTAVSFELAPAVIAAGFALKLLMMGLVVFAEDVLPHEVVPMTRALTNRIPSTRNRPISTSQLPFIFSRIVTQRHPAG
jgi:hypothetical protein